ncbi:MAG: class I SAM-dependent methyltransferase [Paracoccaceae bacterium]
MDLLARLFRRGKSEKLFRSADYWRARYAKGGNSGSGSFGRLAEYKAQIVNSLVIARKINSVIEFGSGDGNQSSLLTVENYVGVDISEGVVEASRARFKEREHWKFLTDLEYHAAPFKADLSMSLDVIYHLVEDQVFDSYMQTLFDASSRFVLIYSSDHEAKTNADHVRHRAYSEWVRRHARNFSMIETFPHPFPMGPGSDKRNTSFASFKLFEIASR